MDIIEALKNIAFYCLHVISEVTILTVMFCFVFLFHLQEFTMHDTIGCYLDLDGGQISFSKNGIVSVHVLLFNSEGKMCHIPGLLTSLSFHCPVR